MAAFTNLNKKIIKKACKRFKSHQEAVAKASVISWNKFNL